MADIRKLFSALRSHGGWRAALAGALVIAIVASMVVCCIILANNVLEEAGGGGDSLLALKDVRTVLSDRFDKFKPVVLAPTIAEKLAKLGVDADKIRQRQVPQNWALSYEKLAADGDFGPRDGHFYVASSRRCTLTGPTVSPESRKLFLKWTLAMPQGGKGKRSFWDSILAIVGLCQSKVDLGIYAHSFYHGIDGARILRTVKLKPGERKTVVVEVDFADRLPDFRPLVKTTGDVDFEEVAVLEAPDDLAAAGLTLVEGTLEECSAIPDPAKSDYPDCRFVCHFTGNSIIKGAPCPQNLSLVMEAYADHKLPGTSRLKPGDKVRCLVMPFEKLPEERKSTQQADDLNLLTLPKYYAMRISGIRGFVDNGARLGGPTSGIQFSDVNDDKIVLTDWFDSFKRAVPPPATITHLEEQGVDVNKLWRFKIARNWNFDYGNLPADIEFGARRKRFFAATEKTCTLLGSVIQPESRKYAIKWIVGMPKDARSKHAKVELGICSDGLYASGEKILQTVELNPGEHKLVDVEVDLSEDFSDFRLLAKVSGDVDFKTVMVKERKDDLAAEGMTLVEGTLEECSAIPDPKLSDYPDCRFVCHFTGNSIIKGVPCPQNLSLVIEGFANHKLLGASRLKAGDKVRCLVMPFEKLPEERKSTQQADDLNLFTVPSYYAIGIQSIKDFVEYPQLAAPASGIFFTDAKKEYVSVFERHINPPLTDEERRLQAEAIQADLAKINAMLAEYTPEKREALRLSFDKAWEAEKKKDVPGFNRVLTKRYGVCVWRNIDNSFWALPENYRLNVEESRLSADKIDALLALRDFFGANGCQFIVSLVPYFYEISARVINKDFRRVPDFQTAYIVQQLLENGIETVYGSDEIITNYNRYPWAYFYPHDPHPSDTVQDVMTDLVAAKLKRYCLATTFDKKLFTIKLVPHRFGNDPAYLFPKNCDIGGNMPSTAYMCREALYDGEPIKPNSRSSVLVFGNSYVYTPILPHIPSFPALLMVKRNCLVDVCMRWSWGPMTTLVEDFFAFPDKKLSKKKVVILAIGVAHLMDNYQFNNIRQIDTMATIMSGKKMVDIVSIANLSNTMALQKNKSQNIRFFKLPPIGEVRIFVGNLTKCDLAKEIAVNIPTGRHVWQNVKYIINGVAVEIPAYYDRFAIINVVHRLPCGTKTLEIKAIGPPGTEFAVQDVQLYQ